jgi:uncharacterized protein (UPF0332 family)
METGKYEGLDPDLAIIAKNVLGLYALFGVKACLIGQNFTSEQHEKVLAMYALTFKNNKYDIDIGHILFFEDKVGLLSFRKKENIYYYSDKKQFNERRLMEDVSDLINRETIYKRGRRGNPLSSI